MPTDEDPPTIPMPGGPAPPSPPSAPAEVGQAFGPYRLLGELGRGGMGVVYRALDTRMSRVVALKTLLATGSPDAAARFQREVETISKLKHPGIVTIHQVGAVGEVPYFAMELLEGEPLSRLLRSRGPLPPRAAARVARDAANALAYAHEQGVVHRDVKPQNVMVEPIGGTPTAPTAPVLDAPLPLPDGRTLGDYRVVLMDFGLARDSSASSAQAPLTQTGLALGTPAYMSPEQAEGRTRHLDALTDVYSLGATLYEMLTGWPPFQGQSQMELMMQVLNEEPLPPRALVRSLPRDLEVICQKAMNKEKAKRYPSAKALADDLDRFLRGELIHARPATRWEKAVRWVRRRPTASALVGLTLLFAIATIGVILGRRIATDRRVAQLRADAEEALARRDPASAREAARRAIELAPEDLDLDRLRGRAEAAVCIAQCDRLHTASRQALLEAQARDAEARKAAEAVPDWAPVADKERVWAAEDAARGARRRSQDLLGQAQQELARALGYERDCPAARERLARIQMEAYLEAEARGDEAAMRQARLLVEFHDVAGRFAAEFDRKAKVSIASDPPGAEVYVFRYAERGRRLVPCPWDVASGRALEPPPATAATTDLSATSGVPGPRTVEALARWSAGVDLLGQGDAAAARTELEAALAIDAELIEAHYELARALLRLGEVDAAYPHVVEAFAGGWGDVPPMWEDPDFAPLMKGPQYDALSTALTGGVPRRSIWVRRAKGAAAGPDALRDGDFLVSVRQIAVADERPLRAMLSGTPGTERLPAVITRGGATVDVSLTCEDLLGAEWEAIDLGPRPVLARREEALRAVREGTAYPLVCEAASRLFTTPGAALLPAGSYLLVLRSPGRVETRYPVCVARGGTWKGTVRLPSVEEFPPLPPGARTKDPTAYWCFLPGGPFRMGLDPSAYSPLDAEARHVDDVFVARYEVSLAEWLEFLNDPEVQARIENVEGQLTRVPRRTVAFNRSLTPGADGRYLPPMGWWERPVFAVSHRDAGFYLAWLRKRFPLRKGFEVDLAREEEWEKAGRGVDGRTYPWGPWFDWTFCRGLKSRPRDARPEAYGQFPYDESPYGVRDLAGGVSEWTASRFTPQVGHPTYRGGSWGDGDPRSFRLASRLDAEDSQVSTTLGMRLVVRRGAQ